MADGSANLQTLLYTKPQFRLVTTEKAFPAFVGGFGSGKTAGLITRALMLKARYPEGNIGYYLPTFDLVNTIAIPRFEEELEKLGANYKTNKSNRPAIHIENCGQIIMRTMDNPSRIIGYEVMDSLIDELDTLKKKDAADVWKKILARNRQKKPDGARNTIAVGTTPEGFRFVYEQWKKAPPSDEYELIKASTYSNARNLPENYIQDLLDSYPTAYIAGYIDGEFTNLEFGAVYPEFDRELNNSDETIREGESLHIGMDFNVTKMAAVVNIMRGQDPIAVAEITKGFDTRAMIGIIKSRWPNHPIFIYPDASGGSRKTVEASTSDLQLLSGAGFHVFNHPSNPAIKDRVLSMNVMIHTNGKRRMKVNVDNCPAFTEALETQAYDDDGEPDKKSGLDHILDAQGYFMSYRFPVIGRQMFKAGIAGV